MNSSTKVKLFTRINCWDRACAADNSYNTGEITGRIVLKIPDDSDTQIRKLTCRPKMPQYSVGTWLANRMAELGVREFYGVPGKGV